MGYRGRSAWRETTSEGRWPLNPERNVDQEFTEEDNTRETEEREGNRMIFLHTPAKQSCRLRESGGNT